MRHRRETPLDVCMFSLGGQFCKIPIPYFSKDDVWLTSLVVPKALPLSYNKQQGRRY